MGTKVQSSVGPMFAAGLPFPVSEILEFVAFCASEKFPQSSWYFCGTFLQNSEKTPETATAMAQIFPLSKIHVT